MRIQQDLPQFEDKKSLIIVASEFQVKYYIAHNGQIELFDQFAVNNPRSQLQEDYLKTTRLGISGSIYDSAKQEVQEKLLRRFHDEVVEIWKQHRIIDTYLFSIDFMMERLKEALPGDIRKTLRFEYPGDMQYHTPLKLLQIIKKKQDEKREENTILSHEEMKIRGNLE